MAGQSPVTDARTGTATCGRPDDTTTDTVLPRFNSRPGCGFWLRIWPTGAVIEVCWPTTVTTKRS